MTDAAALTARTRKLLDEHPPDSLRAKVEAAARHCPNRVIRVEREG